MAGGGVFNPVYLALRRYCDASRALSTLDDKLSRDFGSSWRCSPERGAADGRRAYAELEARADRNLARALVTRAAGITDIAARLRFAFCIACDSDWSSPIIRQLILSAAEDASRLAKGADRELDSLWFESEPAPDSLTLAQPAGRQRSRARS